MNVALIIAGGSGQRMQQDIPKQFLHIHDKPVIIYTLEGFQRNPQIDAIEVVCLDGWHEVLWANAKQFRFLYKGIIIKHNKTEPTYTKTSLFLCEKRRFFMARTEKGVVATI